MPNRYFTEVELRALARFQPSYGVEK